MFDKKAEHPRYKSKRDNRQSYETVNNNNSIRYEDHNFIQIPKVGRIKFRGQLRKHVRILSAVVEHTPTDKWFISVCTEVDLDKRHDKKKLNHETDETAIDLGIKSYMTSFNGREFGYTENPKTYEKELDKLRKEQRRLSRMREHETEAMRIIGIHSSNYEKQRIRVAVVHERIANIRNDFLHKLSRRLSEENQTLVLESLSVKRMMEEAETRKLSRLIADASWAAFTGMLEYKCKESGCSLVYVEEDYPSTKLCSNCGYYNHDITLSMRTITCRGCHRTYDRDANAARNLYKRGLNAGKTAGRWEPSSAGGRAVSMPVETPVPGASALNGSL